MSVFLEIHSMKWLKKLSVLLEIACALLVITLGFTIWSNDVIKANAEQYIFNNVSEIDATYEVALVLGCKGSFDTPYTNPYFKYRMEACAELYKSGKVKKFLLSGDNSRHDYNEPEEMKKALIKLGIPEHCIYLDYAGFRTLDSVVRAKKVFGQNQVLIVSQKFHNERAVFLAQRNGMKAAAFNAQDVKGRLNKSTSFREYLARVKAILDIYLLGTEPKFLGEKIEI